VRLDLRCLVIRQAVYQDRTVGKVIRPTKAHHVRRVAISPEFCELLAAWFQRSVSERRADDRAFVWPGRNGGPMSPSSISHLISKLGRRTGLVDAHGRHVAHLHGLRHASGSLALANGVPLTVVSAQLGHSRPHFTARVYSHVLGDAELDRYADALRDAQNPPPVADTMRETMREIPTPLSTASEKPI